MKLSKAQSNIVKKLRNGEELKYIAFFGVHWIDNSGGWDYARPVRLGSIQKLVDAKVIFKNGMGEYELTPLGKTIEI